MAYMKACLVMLLEVASFGWSKLLLRILSDHTGTAPQSQWKFAFKLMVAASDMSSTNKTCHIQTSLCHSWMTQLNGLLQRCADASVAVFPGVTMFGRLWFIRPTGCHSA